LVRKMRGSKLFAAFLNAVNIASVALILVVCYQLGKDSLTNWREFLILGWSAFTLFRIRGINSAFIVLGGSLVGYLLLSV
jgi:chromate transporter